MGEYMGVLTLGREKLDWFDHNLDKMDMFRRKNDLYRIKGIISSFMKSSSPEERVTFLGCSLGTLCILIILLNMFKDSRGLTLWSDRLCKLNIIVIGISLIAIKYKIQFGCFPAIFICGLDVIVCSLYGLQAVYSLIINSIRTVIKGFLSLLIAAIALLYGQALLEIVPVPINWK